MKYLYDFDSLNESRDADTIKKMVIDFAEKKGKSKWKELQGVILKHKGLDPNDRNNRGQFSSYFSGGSSWYPGETKAKHGRTDRSHGLLMRPTKKDPRYLDKEGDMYVVKTWDGKSKLS